MWVCVRIRSHVMRTTERKEEKSKVLSENRNENQRREKCESPQGGSGLGAGEGREGDRERAVRLT